MTDFTYSETKYEEVDPHWRTACPKCCSMKVFLEYKGTGSRYRDTFLEPTNDCVSKCPYEEHFHITCQVCGHKWTDDLPFKEIKDDGEEDSSKS